MEHEKSRWWKMVLAAAMVAFSGVAAASAAQAQGSYPSKPIRLVVAQSIGGNSDFIARAYSQRLAERFGQQIVVDNRAGAAGIIGTEIVARAVPDGYTLLVVPTGHGINPSLYPKLPYDPQRDFAAISMLAVSFAVLVVNPQLPVRSVTELMALARSRPGKLHFASSGMAAASHLSGELFKSMAGVDIVHVAYKGAPPAVVDLAGGQVEMMFAGPPAAMPLVRSGRLRAIATTGSRRAAFLPEVPTVAESGLPGFESTIWTALLAPARTPAAVITRVHREIADIARQPDLRERLSADGLEAVGSTPRELADYISAEIARWSKVIKAIGLKLE